MEGIGLQFINNNHVPSDLFMYYLFLKVWHIVYDNNYVTDEKTICDLLAVLCNTVAEYLGLHE